MFYYLYQITNTINGKIYIGVHQTRNLNDGYMSSSKIVKQAIREDGFKNFTKTIIEFFDSAESMYAREKEIVTTSFLARSDVYNRVVGGTGVRDAETARKGRAAANLILLEKYGDQWPAIISKMGNAVAQTPAMKDKAKQTKIRNGTFGKVSQLNTPEVIAKKKEVFKQTGHQQKEKNSQFGTRWITNGTENSKVKSTDPLPEGWRFGRSCKK